MLIVRTSGSQGRKAANNFDFVDSPIKKLVQLFSFDDLFDEIIDRDASNRSLTALSISPRRNSEERGGGGGQLVIKASSTILKLFSEGGPSLSCLQKEGGQNEERSLLLRAIQKWLRGLQKKGDPAQKL